MSASSEFIEKFQQKYLMSCYDDKIRHKAVPGVDRINRHSFEARKGEYIGNIARKVLNGTYKFTPYRERLISKGRGKEPRVISLPTIRDRITFAVLHEIITKVFEDEIEQKIVQTTIDSVKRAVNTGKYNYFYKIDISGFYDSLDHKILMKKIRRKIRKAELLRLIESAICTPTVGKMPTNIHPNLKGVPQGISIANDLANVYVNSLDHVCKVDPDIFYVRYVDDILVLCDKKHFIKKRKQIDSIITKKLKLTINIEKCKWGSLKDGFDFLGYSYSDFGKAAGFTVRKQSVRKIEDSIIRIFTQYRYTKNSRLFLWDLNTRITGIVVDNDKYGWLFFYSQIDSISVLYHLDKFVSKMCDNINIDPNLRKQIKKFVKAYYEIINHLRFTRYIPKSKQFTLDQQKEFLRDVSKLNESTIAQMSDDEIRIEFRRKLRASVKDIEKDIQPISGQ